jgi:hypothetical protein
VPAAKRPEGLAKRHRNRMADADLMKYFINYEYSMIRGNGMRGKSACT